MRSRQSTFALLVAATGFLLCLITLTQLRPPARDQSELLGFVPWRSVVFQDTVSSSSPDVDGVQFLYLVQGEWKASEFWLNVSQRLDSELIFLSWKKKWDNPPASLTKYVYFSGRNSSFTTGRNLLLRIALDEEKRRKWKLKYVIFADEDTEGMYVHNRTEERFLVDTKSAGWRAYPAAIAVFHRLLMAYNPVRAGTYGHKSKDGMFPIEGRCISTPTADAAFEAFHRSALEILLPYDEIFEVFNIWMSAILLNVKVETLYQPFAVVFGQLQWFGDGETAKHADYHREGSLHIPILTGLLEYLNDCLPASATRTRTLYRAPLDFNQAAWLLRRETVQPCYHMPASVDYSQLVPEEFVRKHWMRAPNPECGKHIVKSLDLREPPGPTSKPVKKH